MSDASKKGPKNGIQSKKYHVRSTHEKRDDDIMNTNDSSIVSKRSVSKLYFPNEPDFYQPFVQKYIRRNPLINRGYWLRMHAIEQVVRHFLEEDNARSKIVVNLGCGYDPLPFQFWHRYPLSCKNATFVDVDYPQLIEKKRERMLVDGLLRDALLHTKLRPSRPPISLRSERYAAVGCDLRDLDTLERVLKDELNSTASSILFIAEVSITYMPLPDSNALIQWASVFGDARFCLLEQYLPQGPDHPFAQTMLAHFNKLQTPIQAVKKYPSLDEQMSRFTSAGWPKLDVARNLWDLWSDEVFTPTDFRRNLDAVEPFDEWEEFALFAGHYFLVLATNAKAKPGGAAMHACADAQLQAIDLPSHSAVVTMHIPFSNTSLAPRRFGAAFALGHDTLAIHGGQGAQQRLTSIDVLSRSNLQGNIRTCPTPQARICHTITHLNDSEALLVGGRTSPSQALSECWHLKTGEWKQVQSLHPGRFRHGSARVTVPYSVGKGEEGVLVFGGKTSNGSILDDWSLWRPNHGWDVVPATGSRPSARFGAAMSSIDGEDWGLLLGGMSPDGTVLDDVWEYRISAAPALQIHFKDYTHQIHPQLAHPLHARFGASLVAFADSLCLIGGISNTGILGLSDDFLVITCGEGVHIKRATIALPKTSLPLLVGVGAAAVSDNEILLAGGGAVCFSMGSFWNQGYVSITKTDKPYDDSWSVSRLLPAKPNEHAEAANALSSSNGKAKSKSKLKSKIATQPRSSRVPRITLQSEDDFSKLLKASKPTIIQGLDLGPCTKLWTLDYLKEKLGPDREVVIHECTSDRMLFKDKNFQYVKRPVGDFLDGISQGTKTYLRAVSASQPNKLPTKLEDDFPTIAADFQLPEILGQIKETYHSSPLRISGPVSLWLHYDVLANVLCQIRGTKTLRLYPPSDVKYLGFPPGGSSSNTNVVTSQEERLRHTHPHIASLKPGDVLFIPPMWSHTATPEEGHSVAVNVFFKDLEQGYAAGKDVYGNRDLQAYENGRRDVERIVKAFRDVPEDIKKFYLERLAAELQGKADAIGDI